jgi:hypothetical protein
MVRIRFPAGHDLPVSPDRIRDSLRLLSSGYRVQSSGVKRPVDNQLSPCNMKIKNAWRYCSTPLYVCISWCLVKYLGKLYTPQLMKSMQQDSKGILIEVLWHSGGVFHAISQAPLLYYVIRCHCWAFRYCINVVRGHRCLTACCNKGFCFHCCITMTHGHSGCLPM